MPKLKSYAPMFEFGPNETAGNAERYATRGEAEASAADRFRVWTMPTGYHVVETDDPVNGTYADGKRRPVTGDRAIA